MVKETRPNFDEYIFNICASVASRATCRHRDQGAVIVEDMSIISTGYNGAPRGEKDCIELGYCSKAQSLPCRAEGLHGESNAIISAARRGVGVKGATMYCVYSPCRACCNMIKNAGITTVIYQEIYDDFTEGPEYLRALGIGTFVYRNGRLVIA